MIKLLFNLLPHIMNTPIAFTETVNEDHNPSIDTWIRLAEYKDHPHPKGLQCLNIQAAEEIVKHFKSLKGRLQRTFIGIPIYIGHPDDPEFRGQPGHQDTRAYGWVKSLEARDDGLWFYPKWSPAGRELLENAFYRFTSPRWTLRSLGGGFYQPIKLISIGLTNQPNLQCDAIANEKEPELMCDIDDLVGAWGLTQKHDISIKLAKELKTVAMNFDEERAHWQQERSALQKQIDTHTCASNTTTELPTLNNTSITTHLKSTTDSTSDRILAQVRSTMQNSGRSYLEAWQMVRGCS